MKRTRRPPWPLLLSLLACTHPPSAPPPSVKAARVVADAPETQAAQRHARPANREERALVDSLMRETEAIRALAFRSPVDVSVEDRVAMRSYVERAIDDTQLARARQRYLALGVLDPALDIRGLLVALMEEELIGYYDPEQKRLAVRDDIARALERGKERPDQSLAWRATVVHELVHALQDQHFALGERIEEQRTTDADNAFGALVEGDATLAMLAYSAQFAGESVEALAAHPERVLALMTRAPDQLTGALRSAPALIREPLLFRYRDGAAFCAALFRTGGFRAIDEAHAAPPRSTQAIRDARPYLAGRASPALVLPELSWLRDEGYEQRDQDVLGGLELALVLELPEPEQASIIAAWRGDRYVVLDRAGELASLWWIRLSGAQAARSVAVALARLGDRQRAIVRKGEVVLVARNVSDKTLERAAALALAASPRSAKAPREPRSRALGKGEHPLARAAHEH